MTRFTDKVKKLLEKEGICLVSEGNKYDYYACKGLSGKIYEIIYDKIEERYSCTCKNVRHTDCYHITACKKLRDVKDGFC